MPAGPGVRVDTALQAGERVPPDYDPMIAKIMTVGRGPGYRHRPAAAGARRGRVTGIQTTLPFHRALMRDPAFAAGELSTDWVATHWDGEARRSEALARARAGRRATSPTGRASTRRRPTSRRRRLCAKTAAAPAWRDAGRQAAADRWPR